MTSKFEHVQQELAELLIRQRINKALKEKIDPYKALNQELQALKKVIKKKQYGVRRDATAAPSA